MSTCTISKIVKLSCNSKHRDEYCSLVGPRLLCASHDGSTRFCAPFWPLLKLLRFAYLLRVCLADSHCSAEHDAAVACARRLLTVNLNSQHILLLLQFPRLTTAADVMQVTAQRCLSLEPTWLWGQSKALADRNGALEPHVSLNEKEHPPP
jgi:hypothetical protein